MSHALNRSLALIFLLCVAFFYQNCGEALRPTQRENAASQTPIDSPASVNPSLQAFDIDVVYTTTRYMASNGNDNNDGSRASPFRTLQRAFQDSSPGTEVVLLAGTYPALGSLSNLNGTRAAPYKIRGEGQVLINATAGPTGLSMTDPRYVVIENLIIQNSPIHGMNIDDGGTFNTPGEYLVLRSIHFRNIGSGNNNDCLKMSGINNFHIESSSFDNCNMGEAIDMVGCHNGIVTGSEFRNIPQHAAQAKGGSSDVIFHGNRFGNIAGHAINLGGSTDPNLMRPINATAEGLRIRAYANVIERALAPAAFIACHNCEFIHNTVINPQRWPIRILQGGSDGQLFSSREGLVYNNIFIFQSNQVSAFVNIGVGTQPETFLFSNNLWYSTDNQNFNGPNLGAAGPESNSIIQRDPLFINSSVGDYQLQSGSPATSSGLLLPTITYGDFNGQAYRSPPSVGAFESL